MTLAGDVGGPVGAPPVILLHGGGQTRYSWAKAMHELVAKGYFVVNLDARGHGDSDWSPGGNYRISDMAADLRAVIATLPAPHKPALVGASMGGMTALWAVGNSEEPIAAALVLVDIVPKVERDGAMRIGAFMRARPEGFATLDEAVDAVAAYNPHRPRPTDPSGLMRNLRLRDGRLHWHWDPKFVTQTFQNAEPPTAKNALQRAADAVRIPMLLVRGLRSDLVSDAGVADLREHVPQLEVLDISGAGHMVAGDKNDAFNDGVAAFLQRHMPSGA